MSKHTPGPWQISDWKHGKCDIMKDGYFIASAYDCVRDQSPANARLIAAAPAMYGVLQRIVGSSCATADDQWVSVPIGWIKEARAIIAKIEGK